MSIINKIDMFLLSEGSARLTTYAKSAIRLQDLWTREELDKVVDSITKNVKDSKLKYEISFAKGNGKNGKKLLYIFRRDNSLIKRNMSDEDKAQFKSEIEGILKGTGMKIVSDDKAADWISYTIEPK